MAFKKRNWTTGITSTFQSREDNLTSITKRCCVRKCKSSYNPEYEGTRHNHYGCRERKLCRNHYSQLKKVDFQFEEAELEVKEFSCQHCSAYFEYGEDLVNHETLFHQDGN